MISTLTSAHPWRRPTGSNRTVASLDRDVSLPTVTPSLVLGGALAVCLAILSGGHAAKAQRSDQAPDQDIPAHYLPANTALERNSPYVLSTASTGGAFHQGGVALSALVKIKLLPDRGIDLTTKNSTGSMQNMARLGAGETDFAIVQALLGHHGLNGAGPAEVIGPQPDLRAVTMLWPNVEHFIVRKELAPTGSIKDLQGLKGKRLSFGRERSAIESNRVLLANLGLDIARDFDQVFLDFRSSARAFARGEIDGLSLPASTPVEALIDLIAGLGPDAVILSWTDEDRRRADGGLGLWSPVTLPAGTYIDQTDPISTIAQPNFLAVRADMDDDVVYALTKAIFENLPFLGRLHKPFRFLSPETAIAGLPVPLHPGAVRYFKEIRLDLGPIALAQSDYDVFGKEARGEDEVRADVRRGVVGLMTPEDGTSNQLANELLDVLAKEDDLRVVPLKGKGTAHNLADLLYLDGVDVSILQTDAMEYARQQNSFGDIASAIRYIARWHDLEVHLLVRGDILRIEQLEGEPVNFGPPGSGSEFTAARLFNSLSFPVEQTSFGHDIALRKLRDGELAGMIYVAGKPAPLFGTVEVRDGLRFLPLTSIDDDPLYRPASLTEEEYPALVFGDRTIETVSVPSVLAAQDLPADSDRRQPVETFIDRLLSHLDELQADPRHPKWREVDPAVDLQPWRRHEASTAFLERTRTAITTSANRLIGQGGPLLVPTITLKPPERLLGPAQSLAVESDQRPVIEPTVVSEPVSKPAINAPPAAKKPRPTRTRGARSGPHRPIF